MELRIPKWQTMLSFIAYSLALILYIVVMAAPYWATPAPGANVGLWRSCVQGHCKASNTAGMNIYLLVMVQVLVTVSMVMVALAIVGYIATVITDFLHPTAMTTAGLLQLLAGMFSIFVMSLWAAQWSVGEETLFGWTYWVVVVSGCIFFFNGIYAIQISGVMSDIVRQRRHLDPFHSSMSAGHSKTLTGDKTSRDSPGGQSSAPSTIEVSSGIHV